MAKRSGNWMKKEQSDPDADVHLESNGNFMPWSNSIYLPRNLKGLRVLSFTQIEKNLKQNIVGSVLPVQIFLSPLVVLPSIISRFALVR